MTQPVEYSEEYRVPFGDTDAAGVVFYPNYFRWFDRMTHELLRSIGQPLDMYTRRCQAPVLAEVGSRFFTSCRYDDIVCLTARVAEVKTKGFRIEHEVARDGQRAALGFEFRVWVEFANFAATAQPLPEPLAFALRGTTSGRATST